MSTKFIEKLLSIGSNPTGSEEVVINLQDFSSYGGLGNELLAMLKLKNGFFAFESSLQIFPAAHFVQEMTLSRWNSHGLWKFEYEGIADGKLFFAQEAFQDQVWFFDAETGHLEFSADSMNGWAEKILTDYEMQTGHPLMRDWQKTNGRMEPGHRLMPKIPFVLGGEYALSNLYSLNAISAMKSRGNLAKQIKDLPDGAKIQFKIID
jgi:hypothetical protein